MKILIAYDVVENRRRARLSACLQKYATRVQKSIFLGTFDENTLQQVIEEATRIINVKTDQLLFTPQCTTCWKKTIEIGQASIREEEICYKIF